MAAGEAATTEAGTEANSRLPAFMRASVPRKSAKSVHCNPRPDHNRGWSAVSSPPIRNNRQ